jgi:hypothetical protein
VWGEAEGLHSFRSVRHHRFFDFDKSPLTPDGAKIVETTAATAKATGAAHLDLPGRTELSGTRAHNLKLSERRAETARNNLVQLGVPAAAKPPRRDLHALSLKGPRVRYQSAAGAARAAVLALARRTVPPVCSAFSTIWRVLVRPPVAHRQQGISVLLQGLVFG